MRAVLALLLLAAAIWRIGVDWQATIGVGYAFRPGTIGGLVAHYWPEDYQNLVASLQSSGVPFAWNPVGAFVMSLPVALILAAMACAVWLTREPRAARGAEGRRRHRPPVHQPVDEAQLLDRHRASARTDRGPAAPCCG